ncbi:MAG: trigger factor [Clostridiales bacterium]|jgi:trigger factor|nr:trigger factor [Clostridiales bacterium]
MASKFEVIDTNKVKITFTIPGEKFREGIEKAYKQNRGKINIPGFRKGRAPRKIIELNFGKDVFYEDAVNIALPEIYESTVNELKLEVVSRPEIDLESIDEDDGVVVTAEVYTKPELDIKDTDYIGVSYVPMETVVTDEEINAEIDKARDRNSRMVTVSRPVENNDIVTIDFEGFTDGVPFEGGKGEDFNLTIGSNSFIDTFEHQLIGTSVNDDVEVNVTFPEDYRAENLAGKPAMFKVLVKDIRFKELPVADDDFAQDVSDFETFEEYKNSIKEKLTEAKKESAKRKIEDDLISGIVEKLNLDIPESMIDNQVDQMVNDFANQIRMQGMPLETYLGYMGQTVESLRQTYRPGAETQVKGRLLLETIAKNENITVSDEEFEEELKRLAENYGMELDKLKGILRPEDNDGIQMDIKVRKALDLIVEKAVESKEA